MLMNFLKKKRFKPYYKWNTFNTNWELIKMVAVYFVVLNLIINGIPSIHDTLAIRNAQLESFKPYYKWNTFNTGYTVYGGQKRLVGFKPYYKWNTFNTLLNLHLYTWQLGFKPYYKWNTFNTLIY